MARTSTAERIIYALDISQLGEGVGSDALAGRSLLRLHPYQSSDIRGLVAMVVGMGFLPPRMATALLFFIVKPLGEHRP